MNADQTQINADTSAIICVQSATICVKEILDFLRYNNLMRIATKKGDKGLTSLYPAGRVAKDDPRIELVGALDELNAFLGISRSLLKNKAVRKNILGVQSDLFILGTEAVTPAPSLGKLKKRISAADVARLDAVMERFEKKPALKKLCFSIPGQSLVSSSLDVARTICRRAERRAVTLSRRGRLKNPQFLVYLNRLSDFLYLLARSCERT
jgi:cob(I)alamin adenosyltransferase